MTENEIKIGVVSCSGEEFAGGTLSRLAVRKMIDELYPENTVTLCLPLFLAGGKEEREFARDYPTISVDGCAKACARKAIEKYSGKVTHAIMLSDLFDEKMLTAPPLSTRNLTAENWKAVDRVAEEIARKFQKVMVELQKQQPSCGGGCSCGCSCK